MDIAAVTYLAGWKMVRSLPQSVSTRLFSQGADWVARRGLAVEQLRANLERVVGPSNVTAHLVRDSFRSYARYWEEAFRLPSLSRDHHLAELLDESLVGREYVLEALAHKKGMIITLPHTGNWDMAGVLLCHYAGSFTTVAERVKPEVLFQAFLEYRESLGFEVLPLTGGGKPFPLLEKKLQAGEVVCLLGERDMTSRGVPVRFFGEETSFPAGPALLAHKTGASLHVAHSWYPAPGQWGLSLSAPVPVTTVAETTQRIAEGFEHNIAAHPADWHALQPIWPADRTARSEYGGTRGVQQ